MNYLDDVRQGEDALSTNLVVTRGHHGTRNFIVDVRGAAAGNSFARHVFAQLVEIT